MGTVTRKRDSRILRDKNLQYQNLLQTPILPPVLDRYLISHRILYRVDTRAVEYRGFFIHFSSSRQFFGISRKLQFRMNAMSALQDLLSPAPPILNTPSFLFYVPQNFPKPRRMNLAPISPAPNHSTAYNLQNFTPHSSYLLVYFPLRTNTSS